MVNEVYTQSRQLTEEQTLIANFWDCNPFKMNVKGHVMFATKKISPGGHWMNITAVACRQAKADMARSLQAYAVVGVTLADTFIICRAGKYRSNVTHPETYINNYIDGDWLPMLRTPPFPEYTSGHSVIPAAASRILTAFFGDPFAFTDDTEMEFGLEPRSFTSFNAAAEEAAISRMYGGIHYRPAIEYGLTEGRAMADLVWERLNIK
ncbi:MAG: vanadium-dependent haloperoxidase [Flavihumibacter sp.]